MRQSLLENPFVILNVAASATNEEIVDAHDDLSAAADADEAALAEARQQLLSPRTRLTAEMAFLTDTSEGEASRLLAQLASRADREGLLSATERLSPLSKSNLIVAIIETFGLTSDLLVRLISAQADIAPGDVVVALRRVREKAGVVMPTEEGVVQALEGLFEQHARSALRTESDPCGLAKVVTFATEAICATKDADRFERLDALQQAYWRIVSRDTASLRSDLAAIGERLLEGSGEADVNAYIDALRRWDVFGQPLQLLERARGREDREAQAVQKDVRALCLDLANEKKRSDVALRITEVAREVFAELERTASALAEDLEVLRENAALQAARPIEDILERLRTKLDAFAREIEAGRTGAGTEWATLFETLSETLRKTKGQDASWILLRSFGVDLFNESKAAVAARAFVTAVLERAREASASPEIVKRLETDLADLDGILAQKRLAQAVEKKKWDEALRLAEGMAASARTPDEREQSASLVAGIRRAQNRRDWGYAKWTVMGLVGLGIFVSIMNDQARRSPPSYYPPPAQTPAPPAPRPTFPPPQATAPAPLPPVMAPVPESPAAQEIKPSNPASGFGEQRRFSIGNIRYCLFESERLERLRAMGSNTDGVFVDRFNEAIADWNAYCSRYSYLPSDMEAVRAEVRVRADEFSRDARARAQQWGRAALPSPPTTLPLPPITSPLPPSPQPTPEVPQASIAPSPPVDLLDQDLARRVQVRLAELGYLKGPASGTWGPASRAAMRAFNLAHALGDTDLATSGGLNALFASSAVRAGSPTDRLPPGHAEARYPPPPGALLNPLNSSDAITVHRMLRDLGFYKGRNDALWSGASRVALREFKAGNGLPADDVWDVATESALERQANDPRRSAERDFQARIVGRWTTDVRSCARQQPGMPLPIVIAPDRATVAAQGCEFTEKSGGGDQWTVKASCRANGDAWTANIRLSRNGDSLTWTSERGTTIYRRCDT